MQSKLMVILSVFLLFSSMWITYLPLPVYAVAPNAPTSLSTTATSISQINLSWTASTLVNTITATGGTITTNSGRTIHAFTSSGTYTVSSGSGTVQALVVGGGGGGGACPSGQGGGGGGAGGFTYDSLHSVTSQSYTVTVGSGGSGTTVGGNSVFDTITSTGGGAGGYGSTGGNGGSGGGGGSSSFGGGTGTGGQGNNGGSGGSSGGGSGGGGGAGAAGQTVSGNVGGNGGNGIANSISGSSVTYAGGGGGGTGVTFGSAGTGGTGGGASGRGGSAGVPSSATANSGGGGGGCGNNNNGGLGGSGIVIISEVTHDPVVTGYKIERSLNNSTWTTIVANTTSTATTYSDTGLTLNTVYYYRVSAINHDGISSPSNISSTRTFAFPSPTTLNNANTQSPTAITPSWSTSPGATWYLVKRESPVGGGFSQIANTSSLIYADSGLTPGTQYNYEILAGNSSGIGSPSNTKSNYTTNVAPTSLTFGNVTTTGFQVLWINPSGNFSGFKIEMESPIGGGWNTIVSNTNNSINHYNFTGLDPGTQYNVRLSTNYATGSAQAGTSSPSSATFVYTIGGNSGVGAEGYFKSGRWYSSNTYSAISPTTQEASMNVLRAFPFIVGKNLSLDQIQFETTTPTSSANCSVGIYKSDSNLYPTSLTVDGGSKSVSTIGLKSTTINTTLSAGNLYWLAYSCSGSPTLSAIPASGIPDVLGYSGDSGLGTQGVGWTVSHTYNSTLPSVYPANGTILSNINGILIQVRAK